MSPGDAPWALGTAQSVLVRSDVPLGPLSPFDWLVFSLRPHNPHSKQPPGEWPWRRPTASMSSGFGGEAGGQVQGRAVLNLDGEWRVP